MNEIIHCGLQRGNLRPLSKIEDTIFYPAVLIEIPLAYVKCKRA